MNHASHPGTLSFWLGASAVQLEVPAKAGGDGRVVTQVTTDPVNGDTQSGSWSSLVLTPEGTSSGYVTGAEVALGVMVSRTAPSRCSTRGK